VLPDDGQYSLVFVDTLGRRLSEKDGTLKLVLDPFSFFRNFPNQTTRRFTIDAHGYRGGFSPDDPRPRVLVLGGSTTFGFGLGSDAETVSARLQALEPRWQVVNAAVVGHLSGQELSELVHRGDEVLPAAVVVLDGWNDVYVPLLAATRFPTAGMPTGQNWDVFHLVSERLRLLTLAGVPEGAIPTPERPLQDLRGEIVATYLRNLRRMSDVAASRGARFIAAFQPWVPSRARPGTPGEEEALKTWRETGPRGDPALYDDLVARARDFCEQNRISYVDLHGSGAFRDAPGPLFIDVVHPNAEGHARMAEVLRARLDALLP
jgi:lysophospholipase L1-like esterase